MVVTYVVKLLVGMQGSGKTTYCAEIEHDRMAILHGDNFSTPKAMLRSLHSTLHNNIPEIILDRTFGSVASREPYLDLISNYPMYRVEYIVFTWEMEACIKNLCYRSFETGKVIPYIALQTFVKNYEPPSGVVILVEMYKGIRNGEKRAAFFDESVAGSPQFASAVAYFLAKNFFVFFKGKTAPANPDDFTAVYICTHSRGMCLCNKPLPLFAYKANNDFGIALNKSSIVFGDDSFAQRVGMKTKTLE